MRITALDKYRARKACLKELASLSPEELELEHRKLANPHPPSYEDIFGKPQSQTFVEPVAAEINDDSARHSTSSRRSAIEITRLTSREDSAGASRTSSLGSSQG